MANSYMQMDEELGTSTTIRLRVRLDPYHKTHLRSERIHYTYTATAEYTLSLQSVYRGG